LRCWIKLWSLAHGLASLFVDGRLAKKKDALRARQLPQG
jgi:hypothetical protein